MSSRQLRKLQKQRELEALEARAKESSEESEDEVPIVRTKPSAFAGFAALGGDDDGDDDDGDGDNNDDDDDGQPDAKPKPAAAIETPEAQAKPPSSKKSKKKKKKAKKAAAAPAPAQQPTAGKDGKDDDEIDRAIRELKLAAKDNGSDTSDGLDNMTRAQIEAYDRICELLSVNTQHLKVMTEMRRMFGRDAIATVHREEQEEQAAAARQRQRRGATQEVDLETYLKGRPGQSLPEVTLRRNPFLEGKETWPKAPIDGLTTEEVHRQGLVPELETVEFRFAHDNNYNEKEQAFFSLVQMFDPMQLVHFLHRNPYHVSTLIQVTKVAKQDQNMALAADLCERALFTFGRVSISLFRKKMQQGRARLDFNRPENRQFWLAGYHYLSSLMHKGTHRTALEWAKLLYSMDLSDPYGVIWFLQVSAIRSGESAWFIDFCESGALEQCDTEREYVFPNLILAKLQQGQKEEARELLVDGMEGLPWLYSALFKAIGLDVPKIIWGFTPRDKHEELYVELYIHFNKKLWDNSQATALLKEAAALATKPNDNTFAILPTVGRNLARFVYLDNTPALMGLVPDGMLASTPNWEFDPLPPLQIDNIFSYETQKAPWQPAGHAALSGINPRRVRELQNILERMQRGGNNEELMGMVEELRANADDWSDDEASEMSGDETGDTDGEQVERAPGTSPRLFNGALQAVLNAMGIGGTGGQQEPQQPGSEGDREQRSASETRGRIPGAYVEDYDESEDEASAQNGGTR